MVEPRRRAILVVLTIVAASLLARVAEAAPLAGHAAHRAVTLQLKWHHQFQFAGYYAARDRGFFADEGLDVDLIEGEAGRAPIPRLASGAVDFAISDSDGLLARLRGTRIVALAAIFQRSPYILLSVRGRGVDTPGGLVGKRIMADENQGLAQLRAMLVREGIDPASVSFVSHSWSLDDLISGRVDAVSAYVSVEPAMLRARGVEPSVLDATNYGVDFYGDTLYAMEPFVDDNPEVVDGVVRATARGWRYAFDHQEELIGAILRLPGVASRGVTREQLEFEATQMRKLVLPDLVEIGHMNPGRWERIAASYVEIDAAPRAVDLSGFVRAPEVVAAARARRVWWLLGALAIVALLVFAWTVQLGWLVRRRTRELVREIGQRQRAEVSRSATEASYRQLFESARDLLIMLKGDGTIESINPAFEALMGCPREPWIGRLVSELVLPEDLPAADGVFARATAGEKPEQLRLRLVTPGSEPIPMELAVAARRDAAGAITGLSFAARDVRERERFEATLRQSQKMEAIGQIAGGIAHDMNNVLAVVSLNAELLRATSESSAREVAEEIDEAARRGAAMVRQLLAFSRRNVLQRRDVDLNDVVRELGKMLGRLLGEHVTIVHELTPARLLIRADPGMLDQLVINLAVNARDAMPDGGRLLLRTELVEATRPGSLGAPAPHARLDVVDAGTGIDPATLAHIFEPFFTTKELGKGTGLGLSTVFGIAEQHGGWVGVETAPGLGSTFSVYLPMLAAALPAADAMPALPVAAPRARAGETVLVVEDDPAVRKALATLLASHGFGVVEADSGPAALARFGAAGEGIGAVVTDMVMPGGLDGVALARRLRALRSGLPVLVVSGYSDELVAGDRTGAPEVIFLPKPYSVEAILGALRGALDTAPRPESVTDTLV
jgi:PAS domain S-box-containing protein